MKRLRVDELDVAMHDGVDEIILNNPEAAGAFEKVVHTALSSADGSAALPETLNQLKRMGVPESYTLTAIDLALNSGNQVNGEMAQRDNEGDTNSAVCCACAQRDDESECCVENSLPAKKHSRTEMPQSLNIKVPSVGQSSINNDSLNVCSDCSQRVIRSMEALQRQPSALEEPTSVGSSSAVIDGLDFSLVNQKGAASLDSSGSSLSSDGDGGSSPAPSSCSSALSFSTVPGEKFNHEEMDILASVYLFSDSSSDS